MDRQHIPNPGRYLGDGQYDFYWTGNKTGVYDVDVVCLGKSIGTAPYTVTLLTVCLTD